MKFCKHNENPKTERAGDCVIRALAFALDKTWDQVFDDLCLIAKKKYLMPNSKPVFEKYLKDNGFIKRKQPTNAYCSKINVREFIDHYNYDEKVVIYVKMHLTVAQGDTLYDTWDCRSKTVGNYWIKERKTV